MTQTSLEMLKLHDSDLIALLITHTYRLVSRAVTTTTTTTIEEYQLTQYRNTINQRKLSEGLIFTMTPVELLRLRRYSPV